MCIACGQSGHDFQGCALLNDPVELRKHFIKLKSSVNRLLRAVTKDNGTRSINEIAASPMCVEIPPSSAIVNHVNTSPHIPSVSTLTGGFGNVNSIMPSYPYSPQVCPTYGVFQQSIPPAANQQLYQLTSQQINSLMRSRQSDRNDDDNKSSSSGSTNNSLGDF